MYEATQWQNKDFLNLSTAEWLELLQRPDIIDHDGLDMINFLYQCPDYTATVTKIANHVGLHCNKVTANNIRIANKIYNYFSVNAPVNEEGSGKRYWNVLFDGIPKRPKDKKGHFRWKLRPNLALAWEQY